MERKLNFLKETALFEHLTLEELKKLSSYILERTYQPGEEVVREGEVGKALYIIERGCVRVEKTIGGIKKLLAKLGRGDFFGELCLFNEGLRTATVIAEEKLKLAEIEKAKIEKLTEEVPQLAAKLFWAMLRVMAERLVKSNESIKNYLIWIAASRTGIMYIQPQLYEELDKMVEEIDKEIES